ILALYVGSDDKRSGVLQVAQVHPNLLRRKHTSDPCDKLEQLASERRMLHNGKRKVQQFFRNDIVERRLQPIALSDRFRRLALFDPGFVWVVHAHGLFPQAMTCLTSASPPACPRPRKCHGVSVCRSTTETLRGRQLLESGPCGQVSSTELVKKVPSRSGRWPLSWLKATTCPGS